MKREGYWYKTWGRTSEYGFIKNWSPRNPIPYHAQVCAPVDGTLADLEYGRIRNGEWIANNPSWRPNSSKAI